jgi:hypothetical protein
MLSACSLSLSQRAATARRPIQSHRRNPVERRTPRRHVVRASQERSDDEVLVVNRRGALAATALTSATLATGGSLLTPADAQAMISGYMPAGGPSWTTCVRLRRRRGRRAVRSPLVPSYTLGNSACTTPARRAPRPKRRALVRPSIPYAETPAMMDDDGEKR